MPRNKACKICGSSEYFEIEAEIRRLVDERGGYRGVATDAWHKFEHVQKWYQPWLTHVKKHFIYEKATRAIDEDEVLDAFIEKGYNELSKTDTVPLNQLLSAISIKTKRSEVKAKQDLTRAMITAFVAGGTIEGEVIKKLPYRKGQFRAGPKTSNNPEQP